MNIIAIKIFDKVLPNMSSKKYEKNLNKNMKRMYVLKKNDDGVQHRAFAHSRYISLSMRIMTWKLSNRGHDSARKAGRSTLRQKLICRVRERRDVARRLLISSLAFARERNWFPSRTIPESLRAEGPIDSIEKTGWYTRERYYARENTTGRHDPAHHSIESYIRPTFTWQ